MSPVLILLSGAAGTYALRVLFITVVPAHRLPERLRRTLPLVGPAALAALVGTDLGHAAAHPTALWPAIAAVLAGGLVAGFTRNLALTIVGGFVAALLVSLLL